MKSQKNISELFRNSQHRLDERPSERSWERLEQRLDQHRRGRRVPIYRRLYAIAAVIALLIMVSVVSLMLPQYRTNDSAARAIPAVWEELGPYADASDDAYKLVELQYKYHKRLDSPLPEGEPDRKIVALSRSERQSSSLDIAHAAKPANTEEAGPTAASVEPPAAANAYASEEPIAMAGEADENREVLEHEESDAAKPQVAAADYPKIDDKVYGSSRVSTVDAASVSEDKEVAKKKDVIADMSQFNWLLGQWQGRAPAGYQVENWQLINATTIEGSGQLITNGDTLLIEKMRIQQLDGRIFYLIDTDGSGHFQRYPLVGYTAQQAVFENKAVPFPQQIILQQATDKRQYSTTLQNATPSDIEPQQQIHLNQRNYINTRKVVERNLRRAND